MTVLDEKAIEKRRNWLINGRAPLTEDVRREMDYIDTIDHLQSQLQAAERDMIFYHDAHEEEQRKSGKLQSQLDEANVLLQKIIDVPDKSQLGSLARDFAIRAYLAKHSTKEVTE